MTSTILGRAAIGAALAFSLTALGACNSGESTEDTTATAAATDSLDAAATMPGETTGASASASESLPTVGGAPMYPNKTIVENASESKDHTTLVTAVKAAGLVETLSGAGPFTVFAPTNAAFDKLPDGTVETLTQPAQKAQLTSVLTYHVVPGNVTAAELTRQIEAGGGSATLTTVNGAKLTAKAAGGGVQLTDAAGGTSMVTQADVKQSNGVVHVIDTVLMPKKG